MKSDIARSTDPSTSHEAGVAVTGSGERASMCRVVLAALKRTPGLTGYELAKAHGLCRYTVARRMSDLHKRSLVYASTKRACNVTNHRALTWFPVENVTNG